MRCDFVVFKIVIFVTMSDCDVPVEFFTTNRGGKKLYIEGYTYTQCSSRNKSYYWICELRNDPVYHCKVTVKTLCNGDNVHILSSALKEHNHDPDPLRKKVAEFKAKLKEESLTNKKVCKILNDTKKETDSDLLDNLPHTSALKQIMYRNKRKLVNKLEEPENLNFEINENFTMIENKNFIIKECAFDKKRIFLMSTLDMMTILGKANYWIMDGTFKSIPSIFGQLYTIHGNIFLDTKKTFPLLFCLCSHKDKRTYDVMFELIMEYAAENNIEMKPKVCILDFEKAAITSLRYNFANIILQGCHFHLGQIIYRRIQTNNLATKYAKDMKFHKEMKCLLALSYLQESEIPIYFNKYLQQLQDPDSKAIAEWFEENYILGTVSSQPKYPPDFWSCYENNKRKIPRTQNSAEGWHHKINEIIDKHNPGFYHLINELIKASISNKSEINAILSGAPPEKKRKIYEDKDARIERILQHKDDYSEVTFLMSLATHLKL